MRKSYYVSPNPVFLYRFLVYIWHLRLVGLYSDQTVQMQRSSPPVLTLPERAMAVPWQCLDLRLLLCLRCCLCDGLMTLCLRASNFN